jgi:hypothetical protein
MENYKQYLNNNFDNFNENRLIPQKGQITKINL